MVNTFQTSKISEYAGASAGASACRKKRSVVSLVKIHKKSLAERRNLARENFRSNYFTVIVYQRRSDVITFGRRQRSLGPHVAGTQPEENGSAPEDVP